MFDKRCAICGDMVGPYGDGKWLHVANQYPDPPHEVVLAGHMQRCGAGQGGMFCICDSLQDERNAGLDAARDAVAAELDVYRADCINDGKGVSLPVIDTFRHVLTVIDALEKP